MSIKDLRFEKEGYLFINYSGSDMVNIYMNGYEIDVFTDYSIEGDRKRFEESCKDHLDHLKEAGVFRGK